MTAVFAHSVELTMQNNRIVLYILLLNDGISSTLITLTKLGNCCIFVVLYHLQIVNV